MKKVIILGSSRSFGNTRQAISQVFGNLKDELVDLNNFNITQFDYNHRNAEDDFAPLVEKLVEYDTLVIATPVYWYSMSSIMKIFIDRISDLLSIKQDLGRKLRGKSLYVIASFDTSYPKGFEDTFMQICDYLGIKYLGTSFIYSGLENIEFLANNLKQIAKAKTALKIKTQQ